jgi:hypothetical protein
MLDSAPLELDDLRSVGVLATFRLRPDDAQVVE